MVLVPILVCREAFTEKDWEWSVRVEMVGCSIDGVIVE